MKKNNKDFKRLSAYTNMTTKCKCGHSIVIPAYVDMIICNHCGNKVYNKTKEHFKYQLRKQINK